MPCENSKQRKYANFFQEKEDLVPAFDNYSVERYVFPYEMFFTNEKYNFDGLGIIKYNLKVMFIEIKFCNCMCYVECVIVHMVIIQVISNLL